MLHQRPPQVSAPVRCGVELFEIVADFPGQAEDVGWYFQLTLADRDLGDPQGPYPSRTLAQRAAVVDAID